MGALLDRIEDKKLYAGKIEDILDEAMFILFDFREDFGKIPPLVVIADGEMIRLLQTFKAAPQVFICSGLACIRQIAGKDAKVSVALLRIDGVNTGLQACLRVEAVQRLPSWHEVEV